MPTDSKTIVSFSLIRVRNFFEQHIAELAGDLVCRPRAIGDHRRVGLPRRFAAEHFLFPGHNHARICNRRARQLPARNRYDQGAGPNPFGLDHWRTSASCNANDRRMLDRVRADYLPLRHRCQAERSVVGEALAMRFGRTKNLDVIQRWQSPANRQELTACLAPAADESQHIRIGRSEISAGNAGGSARAPDVERRAGYQRQQIAAFLIEEQNKIGIFGAAKKRIDADPLTGAWHR